MLAASFISERSPGMLSETASSAITRAGSAVDLLV
jgi:hypothetical protein